MSLADFNRAMAEEGFFVLPAALPADQVEALREGLERGVEICAMARRNAGIENAAGTAHHLPAFVGEPFLTYLEVTPANEYVSAFFGGKPFVLNSLGGQLNLGSTYASAIHRDVRSWWVERVMLNSVVVLDPYTKDTGATWLMKCGMSCREKPSEDTFAANAVQIECAEGSIILFDSRVWHRAGVNRSNRPRRICTPIYSLPIIKQGFDYCRAIGYRNVEGMSEALKQQLGYYARVPATIHEWYQPKESRLYRGEQG